MDIPYREDKRGMRVTPRVAISQAPYHRDLEVGLARALQHMRQARQLGADLIVFPEWFLGLNPVEVLPNRQTDTLAGAARELSLMVITGSLRVLDPHTGKKQQRAVVLDVDGRLVGSQAKCEFYAPERPWFEPAERIQAIATRYGRIVLLMGPDALSPVRWQECREEDPSLVVMATSPRTQRERESLADIVLGRSLEIGGMVVLAPLMGRFAGATYVGGALAASKGRVLVNGDPSEGVVLASAFGAALIQLGVTDAASWSAVTAAPPGLPVPEAPAADAPEPERRVVLDWGLLCQSDPLPGARLLKAQAEEGPRVAALAPLRPDRPAAAHDLLADGAAGLFAWPALTGVALQHDGWQQGLEHAARSGRPLVVQFAPGPYALSHARPLDVDDWAVRYPSLPIVLLGTGGHRVWAEEALLLARVRPNVWIDVGGASAGFLAEALETAGPDRVVFSSAGQPNGFPAAWQAYQVAAEQLGLAEEVRSLVAGANARRLFFRDTALTASRSPARRPDVLPFPASGPSFPGRRHSTPTETR
jgi:predicted amidohydrolase